MKKSLLALAVTLVAASGANAAWNTGVNSDLVTGNGELILSVWDNTTQNSYTQDLGITYNQLVAGYSGSISLDSAALAVFTSTTNLSTLQYSVLAASNAQYSLPNYDAALTNAGIIATLAAGQTPFAVTDANNYNFITGVWENFNYQASALGWDANTPGNPVKTVTAGALGYANSGVFENYLEINLNRDLSGSNGQASQLWLQSFADNDGVAQLQRLLGTVTLNISSTSAGSLTFASSAPAVPVPAAVWLMGSALAGLGSIARKRRQQV